MSKLWQKSTTDTKSPTAKKVETFTVGNDYRLDLQLVPFDIQASKVHAGALGNAGILSEDEVKNLTNALDEIHQLWESGQFEISIEQEDMHTAIEQYLTQKLGEPGKKIHTGRSRNDQVLTAMRLFEKRKIEDVWQKTRHCASILLEFAETHSKLPMPGFTHTRKAMLSTVGLWAGGFAELMILQLHNGTGIQKIVNQSPLGTAAGFGTTFGIDRDWEAQQLGFESPLICATSAQLSRGWVELQLVQYLSSITGLLNRFASDVICYSGESHSFFDLDPVVCTGSSIMPQKKNPDVAELIRAGHAEITGHAATLQMLITNLGSGYHRDLQLGKEPVLAAFRKTEELLEAAQILVGYIRPNPATLKQACSFELFAAEAANQMVKEDRISFREAYQMLGENPELANQLTAGKLIDKFTQLGSPGNPGLERLRKSLESVKLNGQ